MPRYANKWPESQKGMVATFVAIIVLVATLVAAAALMVSVDSSNVIAGNMAFRQGLIQESERAYAAVIGTFQFDVPADDFDIPESGYYATIRTPTLRSDVPDALSKNPTWTGTVALPISPTGNVVHYVLERICTEVGVATKTTCEAPLTTITGGSVSNQTGDQGNTNFQPGTPAAYRLTVRVDGPRNAVSYMQTILR